MYCFYLQCSLTVHKETHYKPLCHTVLPNRNDFIFGYEKKSRLTVKPTIPWERKKNNIFFLSWCLKFDLKICLISQITINFKQILYPYIQLYSDEKNFFLTIKNDFSPAKSVETHNT